jgi:hypothetical protein
VFAQVEQFTLADLSAQLPVASPQLIKKVLAELKKAGGSGSSARGEGRAGKLYCSRTASAGQLLYWLLKPLTWKCGLTMIRLFPTWIFLLLSPLGRKDLPK